MLLLNVQILQGSCEGAAGKGCSLTTASSHYADEHNLVAHRPEQLAFLAVTITYLGNGLTA